MKKDRIIEMAFRELRDQCKYAKVAYQNLQNKGQSNVTATFSSIHSFLSHCGLISKLLKSEKLATNFLGKNIGNILGVSETAHLHNRNFRNSLEHYDERLATWINNRGQKVNILDNNIGPKDFLKIENSICIRHYDPVKNIYTLLDEDLDLGVLYDEVLEVEEKLERKATELTRVNWDDLDDDEKQMYDEDRLLDELEEELDSDPEEALSRIEDLGYDLRDFN